MAAPASIYLIGLMGSGKTTVGRRLAARLDVGYVDNDEAVAGLAGVSSVELARRGGSELHEWEARYVTTLLDRDAVVVAGIAASSADRPAELAALAAAGLLVYLHCPPAVLAARVRADGPRPWLPADPETMIADMYERRDAVLREHATIVDATVTPDDAVTRIVAALAARR
ncbi:shikimate kinase [Jatrophihabitans endophyticus]|uniref:Shikimate kinase n=1 Tax=Jatrophihabitans endophyticus TaxID=1206085 RepID=A0A1M5CTD9_9ACTN|nr:shikimate kinase [Jatrophihabitans endophyticus]SHF58028.1 shikimate kinase [Jatrophihabitans endophyticus]